MSGRGIVGEQAKEELFIVRAYAMGSRYEDHIRATKALVDSQQVLSLYNGTDVVAIFRQWDSFVKAIPSGS